MKILKKKLLKFAESLTPEEQRFLNNSSDTYNDVFPFNKIESIIIRLISLNVLSYDEYQEMRENYVQRNKYLPLFELAPRTFGETWGQNHLKELVPDFTVPKKDKDPTYDGEYDLLLDDIHVEVKASRVVHKKGGETLAEKALSSDSDKNFDMNFQQLKPGCCDVFVWVAVWRNKIDYWVLSSKDVQDSDLLSNQHRGASQSQDGKVVEGQIHINKGNYKEFEKYRVQEDEIAQRIREIGKRAK